jgi:hypothetical protein
VDQRTRDNWRKIKEALEIAGKTDCMFYRRAVVIANGGKDPFDDPTIGHPKIHGSQAP